MDTGVAVGTAIERRRGRVYYGWVVLVVAALGMVGTFPGRSLGRGLITEPLLADLRLDRVTFGWITLWATLIGSTFSPACGTLLDRFGTRVVLTLNALLLGVAVLAMSRVASAPALAVTLTLTLGLGQSALSAASLAVVGKWFVRRIDVAMAVFAAIVSVAFIAAFGGIELAVRHFGWRASWAGIGWALVLGLTPLAWLLVRRTPESVGLIVDGDGALPTATTDQRPVGGATLGRAMHSAAFWAFALSAAVFNLIFTGVTTFAERIVREREYYNANTFLRAGMALAAGGLVANFVGSYLARIWPHGRLMAVGMLTVAVALVILPLGRSSAALYTYALLMGAAGGVVTVVFFGCWAKAFGRAHLGRIQGAAQVMTVVASAAGPVLLALGERSRGSMAAAFLLLAPVAAALAILCWIVPVPVAQESRGPAGGETEG
jgi:MFS family permease